jgi:hypothetical protein
MIIAENSPFRRLPAQLNRKQALYFEGIRYSVEITDIAYNRLRTVLAEFSPSDSDRKDKHLLFSTALQDAWTIVDSIHRLRQLITRTPGIKQKVPALEVYKRKTAVIQKLRHAVQHLDTEIPSLLKQNLPIWGVLTWVKVQDCEKGILFSCALVPGTVYSFQDLQILNPLGKEVTLPVDLFNLSMGGNSICLSEVIRLTGELINGIEPQLENQFRNLPTSGSDLLVMIEVNVGQEV